MWYKLKILFYDKDSTIREECDTESYTWHILYECTHMVGLKVMFEFVPIIKKNKY
jgi:hypothetical protein